MILGIEVGLGFILVLFLVPVIFNLISYTVSKTKQEDFVGFIGWTSIIIIVGACVYWLYQGLFG